jgi:hypothetical protein
MGTVTRTKKRLIMNRITAISKREKRSNALLSSADLVRIGRD